jgi:sugar-specific transcriptional regulator TrmB
MDISRSLEGVGLTKNEVKVYLALLELGQVTSSKIIKKVGVNSSKVYESLERLLRKGFVSYSIIKNKKNWKAESLENIKDFLKDKKTEFEEREREVLRILPSLEAKRDTLKESSRYLVFEGIAGIKTAREKALKVLKKGETLHVILSSYPKEENLEAYWMDFQKRRARKGIICKYVINRDIQEIVKKRENLPLTEIRYVNSEILSPTWIEIYNGYVGIGVLGKEPSFFLIRNKEVVQGFLNYFGFLWKTGKK